MDWLGEVKRQRDSRNDNISQSPKGLYTRLEDSQNILSAIKRATLGYVLLWGRFDCKYKPDDVRKWNVEFGSVCRLGHDGDREFETDRASAVVRCINIRLVNSRQWILCPKRAEFFEPHEFETLPLPKLPTIEQYIKWGEEYRECHREIGADIEDNVSEGAIYLRDKYGVELDKARDVTRDFVNEWLVELEKYVKIDVSERFDELEEYFEKHYERTNKGRSSQRY